MTTPTAPAPSLTDTDSPAGTAPLAARINALGDFGRTSVLMYLAGYAPEAVRTALAEIERQNADHAERPGGGTG